MKPTGWTWRRLDELGFVGRGKSRHRPRNEPSLYGGPYPFIQTADIMAATPYITTYSQTYSELGLRQSKIWSANTLCMTIAGANTAKVAILKFEACFPDSVVGFIPNKSKADLHFVLYSLGIMKDQFLAVSRGATQDNLGLNKLLSFPLFVPDVHNQRRIAAILSAYDELIENNKQRIALLEMLAEEIYREWFVRLRFPGYQEVKVHKGLPDGWERKSLPEIADITYGFPFDGSRFNSEGRGKPIIRIRNILDSSTTDYTEEEAKDKYIVHTGELLVGMDGEFHINHWYADEAYLVQRVCKLKAKNPLLEGYLAQAIRAPIKHFESILMGATVGHLGAVHLKNTFLIVPPEHLHEQLRALNEIYRQILLLSKAARILSKTRDQLLPRLISGKLSVENLEIELPPGMAKELKAEPRADDHA